MNAPKDLLPWYLNESLTTKEKEAVEAWLQRDEHAQRFHEATQITRKAVVSQAPQTPSRQVETQLLAKIRQPQPRKSFLSAPLAWGLPVAALLFALLWLLVRPGTQLRWSVDGDNLSAFRIYRAPAGSTTFELIEELPASVEQQTYQYSDLAVFPGQTYHYVLEITDRNGRTTLSPVIANNSISTFAAQFAILLTSFVLTFGMITIAQEIKTFPQSQLSI